MKALYYISIQSYGGIIRVASVFSEKAKKWISGRKNWHNRLIKETKDLKNIHWFHCASLGEFEQAKPVIERLKEADNNISILISFFSPSGYEMRKDYTGADYVCYLPIDNRKNASKFIKSLDLKQAYFIKYEFWYYYFTELKNRSIPFYMVSSVFREDQVFFKWYGGWYKDILRLPTEIFLQDKESLNVLESNDLKGIVTGDTRYDRVFTNAQSPGKIPHIEHYIGNRLLLIAGSSWEPEEAILSKVNSKLAQIIIAPHDVSKSHISRTKLLFKQAILYSEWKDNPTDFDVLIIDSIGILSNLYQYGDVAFVGGGFSNALHNILEPACFGLPVCFGNNHEKYREAKEMLRHGAAFQILTSEQLNELLLKYTSDKDILSNDKSKNKQFISDRIGATDLIVAHIG